MKIWVQEWEESEAGWGQRPDGYSLHLKKEDIARYHKWLLDDEAERGFSAENVPQEYSRPSRVNPYLTEVLDDVLKGQIIQSTCGVRCYGHAPEPIDPGADQTGWVPVTNDPKTPSTKAEEEKTKDQLREIIEEGERAKIALATLEAIKSDFIFDPNTHCWTVEENGWLGVINEVPDVDGDDGDVFFSWACMADISHTARWTRTETLHYAKEACLEAIRKVPKGPRAPSRYTDDIPTYGDLFTVDDFREHVACGGFMDHDGSGSISNGVKCDIGSSIFPSRLDQIPQDATHIIWFNK